MGDFIPSSIAYGLKFHEFDDIPKRQKKKLVRLMARLMEKSYKRGVQQGVHFERLDAEFPNIADDEALYKYRYERNLDKSPGIDGFKSTSKERLFMEEGCLREVGFRK